MLPYYGKSVVSLCSCNFYSMESELEQSILRDCQEGHLDRFTQIYDYYVERIFRFIYYKTLHKQTAEDLTSETFFKALRSIKMFRPTHKFSTWLYTIAGNLVIDHFRSHKQTKDIEDVWDLATEDPTLEQIDTEININEIKKHLEKLPAAQREIVMLRVWEEMSYKQISEILGKSEEACKTAFSRAVSTLRTSMPLTAWLTLYLSI